MKKTNREIVKSLFNKLITFTEKKYSKLNHNHDARYYTETEIDTKLASKSNTNHTHTNYAYRYTRTNGNFNDITSIGFYQMNTPTSNTPKGNSTTNYSLIIMGVTNGFMQIALEEGTTNMWVRSKINGVWSTWNTPLENAYAAKTHTHSYAALSHEHDARYYTETEMDTKLASKSNTNHTHSYAPLSHEHDARYYTETEMDTKLSLKANTNHTHTNYATTDHNHDTAYAASSHTHSQYASSTHNHDTAYAASSHTHDDRYYTESEMNIKLASKSDTTHTHSQYASSTHNHDTAYAASSHTHDDRYYTETEMNGKLAGFARTVSFPDMDFNSVTYAGVHGIFKPSANSPKGDTTTSYMLIVKRVNSHSDEIIQVAIEHNTTNMWVRSYNGSRWSAWSTPLSNNYAAKSHSHSQYASSTHNHDDRYYTQTEVCTAIAGAVSGHNHDTVYAAKSHTHSYAASNHNHDSRYYTETEMNTKLNSKANVNHTHSDDMTGTILFNGMVENFPHIANGCGYGTKIILTVTTKIKLNKLFGTGSTACNNLFFGGVISESITLKVDGVMSTARANEHNYDNFHNLSYLFHIHITNMETGDLNQERQKTINSFYAGSNDQYGTAISEFGNGDDKPDMFYRYTTSDISSYNETPHTPYIGIALLQYTSLSELSGELTVTFITTFTTGMAITKVTRL